MLVSSLEAIAASHDPEVFGCDETTRPGAGFLSMNKWFRYVVLFFKCCKTL
jgi:hypothetical protein